VSPARLVLRRPGRDRGRFPSTPLSSLIDAQSRVTGSNGPSLHVPRRDRRRMQRDGVCVSPWGVRGRTHLADWLVSRISAFQRLTSLSLALCSSGLFRWARRPSAGSCLPQGKKCL
jgi:hypothetical protein